MKNLRGRPQQIKRHETEFQLLKTKQKKLILQSKKNILTLTHSRQKYSRILGHYERSKLTNNRYRRRQRNSFQENRKYIILIHRKRFPKLKKKLPNKVLRTKGQEQRSPEKKMYSTTHNNQNTKGTQKIKILKYAKEKHQTTSKAGLLE